MKQAFKILAYLIAFEVVVQASAIAFAVAGIGVWVEEEGGSLDSAAFESIFEGDLTFTGVQGMMIHGLNGMMIIPVLAILLLIVSFFAKVPGGIKFAAVVFVLVALQIFLGLLGHSTPYGGLFHGANALVLFTTALYTARLVKKTEPVGYQAESESAHV
jgi:heme A synthase